MSAKYWVKLYHEILHDRKMATLDDHLWRRVIECFLFAGEIDRGGYLPPLDDMAWILRFESEQVETDLNELVRIGILEVRDGLYFVRKFAERQKPMSKAEYMRRKREEEQTQGYYQNEPPSYHPVTNSNADKIRIDIEENQPVFSHLVDAFINVTGIPAFGMKPRDVEAGGRMVKAGVTAEDIEKAVIELGDNYTIVGLASIETAALNVLRKRNNKQQVYYEG